MASVGALLDEITYEIPLKEALQYPKGKEKWTRADVKLAADGLAAGFLDLGLQPGDTIAAWLPAEDVDLHITQFGAAKAGLTLAVLDEGITREGLEKTLKETGAKALIYAPYRGNSDNTVALQQMIPELASCTLIVQVFEDGGVVYPPPTHRSQTPTQPSINTIPQTTTPRACPSTRPSSRRCGTSSTRAST